MDAIALARAQFAMTIMFHFIFPAITIGLGLIVATLDFAALWLAVAGASAWVTRLDHLGSDVAALLPAMTLAGGAAASLVARTRGRDGWAFVGSTLAIVALMALAAVSLYPALLPATVRRAASRSTTPPRATSRSRPCSSSRSSGCRSSSRTPRSCTSASEAWPARRISEPLARARRHPSLRLACRMRPR